MEYLGGGSALDLVSNESYFKICLYYTILDAAWTC